MMLPISNELLQPLPLTGASSATSLWIHKTRNIFRGVIEIDCTNRTSAAAATLVREVVAAEYKPGFIVPFAFGTILRYQNQAPDSSTVEPFIADTAQSKGTWQWCIAIDEASRQAHGVHMWMRGYLTPVYEELMAHFEQSGYKCSTKTKAPSRMWIHMWRITKALLQAREFLIVVIGIIVAITALAIAFLK
jgi:hypothetical protein